MLLRSGFLLVLALAGVCSRPTRTRYFPHVPDYDDKALVNEQDILALEQDVIDVNDLGLPILVELLNVVDSEGENGSCAEREEVELVPRDLEVASGGAALKMTQYEKDMYQMLFLQIADGGADGIDSWAIENDKPRPVKEGETPTLSLVSLDNKKKFDQSISTLSALDIGPLASALPFIPNMQFQGEAIDQYLDLGLRAVDASYCVGDVPTDSALENIADGVLLEKMKGSVKLRYNGLTQADDKIAQMLQSMVFNFRPGDISLDAETKITPCQYIRGYLMSHPQRYQLSGFGSEAKERFKEGGVDFAEFKKFLNERYSALLAPRDEKTLFRLFDTSSYFQTPGSVPTKPLDEDVNPEGKLDECEFHLAYWTLASNANGKTRWTKEVLWPTSVEQLKPLADNLLSFEEVQGETAQMKYSGFERMMKTVDVGNAIVSEEKFNVDSLHPSSGSHGDANSLAGMLFLKIVDQNVNLGEAEAVQELFKKGKVTSHNLHRFLTSLCEGTPDASTMTLAHQVENAVKDYQHSEGSEGLIWNDFEAALNHHAVLVHGINQNKERELRTAISVQGPLNVRQFVGFMLTMMKAGAAVSIPSDLVADVSGSAKVFYEFRT